MTADPTTMRRCIGSKTHGIDAHEAPASAFPAQPSQRDGLGRMCRTHWNQYTSALRRASLARRAAAAGTVAIEVAAPQASAPRATRRNKGQPEPIRVAPPRKRREPRPPMAHIGTGAEPTPEVAQELAGG